MVAGGRAIDLASSNARLNASGVEMSGLGVPLRVATATTELAISSWDAALILLVLARRIDCGFVDDNDVELLAGRDPLYDAAARVECSQKFVSSGALESRPQFYNDLTHADGGEQLHLRGASALTREA